MRIQRSFIGIPCHGKDTVGMTKVYCSSKRGVGPTGIHLRNEDTVDVLWISQMDNWLIYLTYWVVDC